MRKKIILPFASVVPATALVAAAAVAITSAAVEFTPAVCYCNTVTYLFLSPGIVIWTILMTIWMPVMTARRMNQNHRKM